MGRERTEGRTAGWVYLVTIATGMFSLAYVPGRITAPHDPAATLANIVAHAGLYRAGVASLLVEQVAFLALPLLLFRLLARAGGQQAMAMVALAVAGIPPALAAAAHRLDALACLTGDSLARAAASDQAKTLALHALKSYDDSLFVASLFWGLWLLPFGCLVLKSRALPRLWGALLVLGGCGYLLDVFGTLLLPAYVGSALADYATAPASLGEIGTCLWLVLFGARRATAVALAS